MTAQDPARRTAGELRQEFDAVFARTPQTRTDDPEDFLAIRMAGHPYAVRLSDTSGLFQHKSITALPSPMPGLLGVSGFRGEIVPVYSLSVWMEVPAQDGAAWMLLTRANVAFAFGEFDSYLRIPRDSVLPSRPGQHRAHARHVIRVEDVIRPVADLASILDAIRIRTGPGFPEGSSAK